MPRSIRLWIISMLSVPLLLSAFARVAFAQSIVSVSIDTSAVSGTSGKLVVDFTNSNPGDGNNVQIRAFAAPGATLGLAQTQGGLVSGDLILGLNPANFTFIDSDFFFNEVTVNFVKFSNRVTFTLQVSQVGPPVASPPAEVAFFILDSSGSPLFPTLDPLFANVLFANEVTGVSGGVLNVFGPAVFTPPNNISVVVSALDTVPPVTTATISPGPNDQGWNNTDIVVTLTSTDSEPGGSGVKEIDFNLAGAQTGAGKTAASSASVTIGSEGTTALSFFAIDNAGNQESPKTLIVKIDKTAPVISGLPGADCILFPPNHKLVDVATVSVADALSGVSSFDVAGTSNESPSPGESDIVITGNSLNPRDVQLRAERLGSGTGRVYTVTATATDVAGNTATSTADCVVPHDQGHN